ncbi:MAG: transcription termination/antitermination NusG family protein [Eubacteriales bacterium]|nr:transcription termination/antitermination NusG family protein [Eubacteriales bacterium]
MDWYVLQTLTGREQDAKAALLRAGLDARVSTELRPIHRRGRWTEQEYTLLPGYVFVGMDFTASLYRAIVDAPGAVRLLGMAGERPTTMLPDEAEFWGLTGPPAPLVPSTVEFDAYGTPRIVAGPLKGREEQIIKIDRHARRAHVRARTGAYTHYAKFGIRPVDGDAP